jgi:hypothetical protein
MRGGRTERTPQPEAVDIREDAEDRADREHSMDRIKVEH